MSRQPTACPLSQVKARAVLGRVAATQTEEDGAPEAPGPLAALQAQVWPAYSSTMAASSVALVGLGPP